jgi:3-deoxy-D-arabino-heptulosonate 7-phosphate (DAHP) synthase
MPSCRPCSVHDPAALLEFSTRFEAACEPLDDAIVPVLRVYFENPRTIGQSVTDACLSFDDTVPLLELLAAAVRKTGE